MYSTDKVDIKGRNRGKVGSDGVEACPGSEGHLTSAGWLPSRTPSVVASKPIARLRPAASGRLLTLLREFLIRTDRTARVSRDRQLGQEEPSPDY